MIARSTEEDRVTGRQVWAMVQLDQPSTKGETFKFTAFPTSVINPPFVQYIQGVQKSWNTWKSEFDIEDVRENDVADEIRRVFEGCVPPGLRNALIERVTFLIRLMDEAFPKETTKVGTLWMLKVPCLNNLPGTVGVCYETYGDPNNPSMSLIFPNGRYDRFSPEDMKIFLEDEQTGVCEDTASYAFTTVGQLCRDFEKGNFAEAWGNNS